MSTRSNFVKSELQKIYNFLNVSYGYKMESKFFSEIEKKMDVKTLKDFEKEGQK